MTATIDEYQGVGGAYICDPKTGTRKPAPAAEPEPISTPTPSPQVNDNALTDKKAAATSQD